MEWDDLISDPNPGLFLMHEGDSISFYLQLKDLYETEKLQELIIMFGGTVVQNMQDMDRHTMLIVDDDCKATFFFRPAFKKSYLTDCMKSNCLLNIGEYTIKKFNFQRKYYMDVMYWGTAEFRNIREEQPVSDDSDDPAFKVHITERERFQREPYSLHEKEAILKFIVSRKRYTGLGGNNTWKLMEKENVCPHRTYQSLKNHFRRTLKFELDRFEFLTMKQKRLLQCDNDL